MILIDAQTIPHYAFLWHLGTRNCETFSRVDLFFFTTWTWHNSDNKNQRLVWCNNIFSKELCSPFSQANTKTDWFFTVMKRKSEINMLFLFKYFCFHLLHLDCAEFVPDRHLFPHYSISIARSGQKLALNLKWLQMRGRRELMIESLFHYINITQSGLCCCCVFYYPVMNYTNNITQLTDFLY